MLLDWLKKSLDLGLPGRREQVRSELCARAGRFRISDYRLNQRRFSALAMAFGLSGLVLADDAVAADSLLDWSTRPATNLEVGATDTATVDGMTVTTSGTLVGSRTTDTLAITPTTTTNGYSGIITSEVDATIDNESVYNQVRFDFSEPVYNLRFRLIDVDGYNAGSTRFSDLIVYNSSAGVPSSAIPGGWITYTSATGRARENSTSNCSGNDANCQIVVTYNGPLTWATVRHVAADAAGGNNPTNQAVQIYDLTFNTPPDATNNTNSTFVGGSASGNVITDNDGAGADSDRQDGLNVVVNQISHPGTGASSVGLAGTTLTLANGATLFIARDGSYTFNTNGAYTGLASGASTTETFTYRIQDQEGLFNTGGDVPNPDSVATLVITITNSSIPSFTIDKTVDQASITSPGTLTYTITVDNTGNVPLTGGSLSDTLTQGGSSLTMTSGPTLTSGDSNSNGIIEPTETWVYTATYAVTTANINNGNDILNIAVFDTDQTSSQSDSASTTTPGPTFVCAGDNFPGNTISGASGTTTCSNTGATGETGEPLTFGGGDLETIWYTWTAPLTGTVEFNTCDTSVTDYDTTLGAYTGGSVSSLTTVGTNDDGAGCAAFSSRLSFAATAGTTYRIQVGGYGNGDGTFKLDWSMTAPAATINKSVNQSSVSGVTTLTYTIIVANSGTVDLTGPALTDQLLQNGVAQTLTSGPTLASGDDNADGILNTSETWIYSATYDVTSGNLNDGNDLVNTATFNSNETSAVSDTATTTIAFVPAPSISVTKVADDTSDVVVGQSITYTYTITNDGNQTISNITLSDVHDGSGPPPTPDADGATLTDNGVTGDSTNSTTGDGVWDALAPGDVLTVTATYTITQNDVDTKQ